MIKAAEEKRRDEKDSRCRGDPVQRVCRDRGAQRKQRSPRTKFQSVRGMQASFHPGTHTLIQADP